ncbi:MAG: formate dehydrogenase accessory sulfurtransferase FdhD [Gammaproteobacteria bacterium]|nr:formate dehydrogenase accessory sulfurtransferase FdhD [Gammaproteobacteria bacterium]
MNAKLSRVEQLLAVPLPEAVVTLPVTRWRDAASEVRSDRIAEETPVAILCNGEPHAVMLMSPCDLEDFALGFALTEGLIAEPRELVLVERRALDDGIELDLVMPVDRTSRVSSGARSLAGRSGCGICGKRMVSDAMRTPAAVARVPTLSRAAIARGAAALSDRQVLNRETGAVHAAAWVDLDGSIVALREDIGRHNALDKLIGARARADFPPGFVLVTSRASYEIVMKAAAACIGLLAAVSAPTARAVRLAEICNVTLAGFVRGTDLVIYSHGERITDGKD